jgi:hypothetical protein
VSLAGNSKLVRPEQLQICFYSELVRAKHKNTPIGINKSPFVNMKITAGRTILMVKMFFAKIFDDSQMQRKGKQLFWLA